MIDPSALHPDAPSGASRTTTAPWRLLGLPLVGGALLVLVSLAFTPPPPVQRLRLVQVADRGAVQLPPGHPPLRLRALPPGHPPIQEAPELPGASLPPGHPPVRIPGGRMAPPLQPQPSFEPPAVVTI